ncbi:uncharacterized protein F5891DRAFT_963601 [Suillus fuscotomentosus]|uniref:Uncharacterized protein n=1 Tax=Suillus fuscotomentosus TaxID=1912939 RepID=A0AAD4HCY7_9AGAM|nr:uncharacterized protein F5891DRAFT_963601 [Suillus fuscotomentosus]KAG1893040.1 hypothetical protein F5891DRAFT_963601 [Suillus fuscotomentosus]
MTLTPTNHHLFISASMLASKVICDDTYSNKSWSIVAQGMFQLREINQVSCQCNYNSPSSNSKCTSSA